MPKLPHRVRKPRHWTRRRTVGQAFCRSASHKASAMAFRRLEAGLSQRKRNHATSAETLAKADFVWFCRCRSRNAGSDSGENPPLGRALFEPELRASLRADASGSTTEPRASPKGGWGAWRFGHWRLELVSGFDIRVLSPCLRMSLRSPQDEDEMSRRPGRQLARDRRLHTTDTHPRTHLAQELRDVSGGGMKAV